MPFYRGYVKNTNGNQINFKNESGGDEFLRVGMQKCYANSAPIKLFTGARFFE